MVDVSILSYCFLTQITAVGHQPVQKSGDISNKYMKSSKIWIEHLHFQISQTCIQQRELGTYIQKY